MWKRSLIISRIALFIVGFTSSAHSQDWQNIGHFTGENMPIFASDLASDSTEEFLYFAGSFSKVIDGTGDTTLLQSMGRWDGTSFSTISEVELSSNQVGYLHSTKFLKMFGSQLFARRHVAEVSMPWIEQDTILGPIGKLVGGQWVDLLSELERVTGPFLINGELLVFESLGEIPNQLRYAILGDATEIGQYTSSTYEVFADFPGQYVFTAVIYDEYLYLGGNLNTPQSDLIRLHPNGDSDFVGGGIDPFGAVNKILVFNDQLIVGGGFSKELDDGTTTYNIAAWDGGNWASVFGAGVDGTVINMKIYDGILYILGHFSYAYLEDGLYPASKILAYDGEQVYRVSDDVFLPGSYVSDLLFFRDTMYVSGNFEWIQNTPITSIAKRVTSLPTALSPEIGLTNSIDVTCFPNPASRNVNIRFDTCCFTGNVEILDPKGAIVFESNIQHQMEITIDVSHLKQGVYYIIINRQSGASGMQRILVMDY